MTSCRRRLLALAWVLLAPAIGFAFAQDPQSLNGRLTEALQRESNGHSPSNEDIENAVALKWAPSGDEVRAALPALTKVLESPDGPLRTLGLGLLWSLGTQPDPPAADASPGPARPQILRAETAAALAPEVPQIAARLTDEVGANQTFAAEVLGSFAGNAPPTVFPPLYAYLKRDDGASRVGIEVVKALLLLAPLSPETETAIGKFMHRSDQTEDRRAELVETVAASPNQSQSLNKSIVAFLGAADPNLRARVILSLPQMDLAPDVYAETHTRVEQLVDNAGENLQVVTAAKAVAPCWTTVKMTSGCPVY